MGKFAWAIVSQKEYQICFCRKSWYFGSNAPDCGIHGGWFPFTKSALIPPRNLV